MDKRQLNWWEKDLEISYDVLDLIDIQSYTQAWANINDIMRHIVNDYYSCELPAEVYAFMEEHARYFQDYIFNYMDTSDFLRYCQRRYPKFIYIEETIYRVVSI